MSVGHLFFRIKDFSPLLKKRPVPQTSNMSESREKLLKSIRDTMGEMAEFESVTIDFSPGDAHISISGLEKDVDELHIPTLEKAVEAARTNGWPMASGVLLIGQNGKFEINILNRYGGKRRTWGRWGGAIY